MPPKLSTAAAQRSNHRPKRRVGGFAFITALFLLVILATFAAFMVSILANASATSVLALQGVRGWEAARAGIEWAAYQIKREPTGGTYGTMTLPACFTSPTVLTLPSAMGEFQVSVSCERYPAQGASPNHHEDGRKHVVNYLIHATASLGAAGAADSVERKLEARIEKCKDPDASAPLYACD
ncbi:MAG TPA: hypothetical protein PLQ67_00685 [Burkholderiaceae bacterium]|nr:hypothetical protein [Burkholderiaceae bacterium]